TPLPPRLTASQRCARRDLTKRAHLWLAVKRPTLSPCHFLSYDENRRFRSRVFMHDASYTFLKNLLQTPSPSGFERPVQDVVRAWAKTHADEVRTDRHGNVIAVLHPGGQPRIMLAGHCDQIGLMVQHI